jgi:hypothetical protein
MRNHHHVSKLVAALAVAALLLPFAAARAADQGKGEKEKPGAVTSSWAFWVQPGHEADFQAGLKAHAAWRKANGEGWDWHIFQPIVGDDLTYYVVRSGGHHWADFDAQSAWEQAHGAVAKYQEQMGKFVARVTHHLGKWDSEHSYWTANPDYRVFEVNELQMQPGSYGDVAELLGQFHKAAEDGKYSRSYGIEWPTGGSSDMTIVFPFVNWAGMETPEVGFMKVLADSLGSEDAAKAAMQQMNASFVSGGKTTVYVRRTDLEAGE